MQSENIHDMMTTIGESARKAARVLALMTNEEKNTALRAMSEAIRHHQSQIQAANEQDMDFAKQKKLSSSLLDRLALNTQRIEAMAKSLENIAALSDPIGTVLAEIQRPNGLEIIRIRVPIGVIGVIYESRPNVTTDAAGLCLKSGNAVILRGGSESFYSSTAIVIALHEGLRKVGLPSTLVQMIPVSDRAAVDEMLKMDRYIDVLIPRGGPALIETISANSRIPLFKHLAGLCHTYIHQAADKEMAKKIVLNAKMRRTGICGATEVLLVDNKIVSSHLPDILDALINAGCEIRGDNAVAKLDSRVKLVDANDYDTEFLDAIISVRVVSDLSAAIAHIAQHSTQHTDAIITDDTVAAERFFKEVDSAIVMHNTSTQFADGGEFGMGAEIGIATGKLHARGPVGVEQLTTFKYLVRGNGQIRSI
jgi:glutamate-5-semialdehyde dehydrogenase